MTEIDVVNLALAKLHYNETITSTDGTLANATSSGQATEMAKMYYPRARRQIFRMAAWTCIQRRTRLAATEFSENYTGFAYMAVLPSDYINRVKVVDVYGQEIPAEIEGRSLYVNEQEPVLIYTYDEKDCSKWDDLLIEAVATQLASMLAYPITGTHENEVALAQSAMGMIAQAVTKTNREKHQGQAAPGPWMEGIFDYPPSIRRV